jgi:hypothetical protein
MGDIGEVPLQLLGSATWETKPFQQEREQMRPTSFVPASTVAARAGQLSQSHTPSAGSNSGDAVAAKPAPSTATYIETTPAFDLDDDEEDMLMACVA